MKNILQALALTLGIFLMSTFCALSMFNNTATDSALYYDIQQKENVDAGIDAAAMQELDALLAACLAGDRDALDSTELFNADEKAHMDDVADIFAAMRLVKNGAFALSALMLVWVYYNRSRFSRRLIRICVAAGAALFFLPLVCIGAWAALDFNSAFTAMHHLLFSNDLWLMDPRTDLMIRMLPERFFVSIGIKLAVRSALGAIAIPAIVFIGSIDWSKHTKKNETPDNE